MQQTHTLCRLMGIPKLTFLLVNAEASATPP